MGQFKIVNNNSQSITSGDYVSFPKLTTTERNTLTGVENGAIIYNTTTNEVELFNGTSWETIAVLGDIANAGSLIVTPISVNTALVYGNLYVATNNITCTLPTAIGNKDKSIAVFRAGTNDVIITPTLSQTINGDTDGVTIVEQYATIKLTSDGSNWILN